MLSLVLMILVCDVARGGHVGLANVQHMVCGYTGKGHAVVKMLV
jgi:hypothetical protein